MTKSNTIVSLLPPPAGPRGSPLVGMLPAFRRDPLSCLQRIARDYGPVARFRLGPRTLVLLNDPELINDVLVTHASDYHKSPTLRRAKGLLGEGLLTSEDPTHLRQRRLAAPAFHRRRIAGYAATMAGYAERAQSGWHDGETLDLHDEMMRLTLAIVGKTLFDADVEDAASEVGQALTTLIGMFRLTPNPVAELLERLPLPATRRFFAARAQLDRIVFRMIEERRRSGHDSGDLLSMLLLARDEETGTGMSDRQLRDEALTIFLAGHETTANALTWTWYLLGQNPDVAATLHAELDTVLGDRLPEFDDLARLRYAEQVISEVLRLWPPAWIMGRQAIRDTSFGPYRAPRGTLVVMSQYVAHRDARWFADPDQFCPERWTPEFRASLPRFAYFPFGGGPRVCIGDQFALVEAVLVLATIARRWRFSLLPGHPVAPRPSITLRPRYGMRMTAWRRGAVDPPGMHA